MPRVYLTFEGSRVPADMACPPELLQVLASFGVEAVAGGEPCEAAIIVRAADGRVHFSGPAYLAPFSVDGLDAAAGSVMAGLAACRSLATPAGVLCLHAAAAVIGARGYLFLAPFGTGKSSLMAELALRGAGVLADDVVLLDTHGLAMRGLRLPPRLRRSFIDMAGERMKDWIAMRSILAGPRYTYLSPGSLMPGEHETTDIVLLNRLGEAARHEAPVLEQVSAGVLIPRLLWHNMSRHHAPSALAGMASGVAARLRCSVLHAANFGEAARRLADGSIRTVPAGGQPPLGRTRRDGLEIIRTDRGAIVSDDQSGRIFEINESAFVILTLLQEVGDGPEALEMLRGIYPDAAEEDLRQQLAACTRQLAGCGLVDLAEVTAREALSEPA